MAKTKKEIDDAHRQKKHDQQLFWKGFWVHKSIIGKVGAYVARENKKAIKPAERQEIK